MIDLDNMILEIIKKYGFRGRRKQFIINYVKCHNGSEAYKNAEYKFNNVHQLSTLSSRLMANDGIKKCIKEIEAVIQENSNITKEIYENKLYEDWQAGHQEDGRPTTAGSSFAKLYGQVRGWIKEAQVSGIGIIGKLTGEDLQKAKDRWNRINPSLIKKGKIVKSDQEDKQI